MDMVLIRYPHTDADGRHSWMNYRVPAAWVRAVDAPVGGQMPESAAVGFSVIAARGRAWRSLCSCVECTIAANTEAAPEDRSPAPASGALADAPVNATSYTLGIVQRIEAAGLRPTWGKPHRGVIRVSLGMTGVREGTFGSIRVGARTGKVLSAEFIHGNDGPKEVHEGTRRVRDAVVRIALGLDDRGVYAAAPPTAADRLRAKSFARKWRAEHETPDGPRPTDAALRKAFRDSPRPPAPHLYPMIRSVLASSGAGTGS